MDVNKTKSFARWARKERLGDRALCGAVEEMVHGLFDADLGGGLLKKRVARPGEGKRGGFRTLVATDRLGRWIFVYGFAKNERANVNQSEEAALKKLATLLLRYSRRDMEAAHKSGELIEVNCDAEKEIENS